MILPATLLKVLWLILLDIYVPKITPIKLDRIDEILQLEINQKKKLVGEFRGRTYALSSKAPN